MKLDERHLVQLSVVVDAGGVTEGAALLGASQPAVSRTLAMLEKRVGEPLFLPGRRPLRPTAFGRQLAVHGRAILAASRKASETVASFRGGAQGRVRLAGVPFFMDAVVSGIVASFQMKEPDIHVEQSYGHYHDLIPQLVANEIDLAVTPAGTHEISAELAFEPLIAAIAPLPGSPLMLDLTNILLTLGIGELAIRYSGGSLHSVINYLAASQALAIMPLSVVHSLPPEFRIGALPLNIPQPDRMIGIVYRRLSASDPVNRKFFGHLRSNMENLSRVVAKRDGATPWQTGPFMRHMQEP